MLPLSKDEVELLNKDTQEVYKAILGIDFSAHYPEYIDSFYSGVVRVLDELMSKLGSAARYKGDAYVQGKFRSFGVYVINSVIEKRNEFVRYKRDTRPEMHRLAEALEKIILEPRECTVDGTTVSFDNPILKEKATEIYGLIKSDIPKIPQYVDAYWHARKRFNDLREEYEKKSRFGHFMTRFTGEKRDLKTAERELNGFDLAGDYPGERDIRKYTHNRELLDEFAFEGVHSPGGYNKEGVKHL